MRCIACGCTEERACVGGCSWVSIRPPKCSACFDEDGEPFAVGAEEGGLFGIERCPASETPAPNAPLYVDDVTCYCARCKLDLVA
jgi:hypothetical protein